MFTGIIQSIGTVGRILRRGADAVLEIESDLDLKDIQIGDSIAVNGACLTVVSKGAGRFSADVSAETLSKTNLNGLKSRDRVNLEKSLQLQGSLGGHLVLGHVDGLGTIVKKEAKSASIIFGIEVDESLKKYIVEKGSITVDGVSLTVNGLERNCFYINIIPHTARATTLNDKKVHDQVNIETDIIGKYVISFMDSNKGINKDFLVKHGFLE